MFDNLQKISLLSVESLFFSKELLLFLKHLENVTLVLTPSPLLKCHFYLHIQNLIFFFPYSVSQSDCEKLRSADRGVPQQILLLQLLFIGLIRYVVLLPIQLIAVLAIIKSIFYNYHRV